MSRGNELLAALMGAQAGGFIAQPPGLYGGPGIGIAGVSGVPRSRTWDVAASAHAPDLTGETVTFVALQDGTLVVDDDVPDDSLAPLADAIEAMLPPPYRAAAVRNEGGVWSVAADTITIVELSQIAGDVVELTVVDGRRTLTIDGTPANRPLAGLDSLSEEHGDVALRAERVDADLFAVDVFAL